MKILIIASSYYPRSGGLETVVEEISSRFSKAGHSVAIVADRNPVALSKHERRDGIEVTRLVFLYPRLSHLKALRLDLWLASFFFFPISLIELAVIIMREKPDVVNLQYAGSPSLFVWAAHRTLRFRLVTSLHGGDVDGEPLRSRFARWVFQAVLDDSDGVTACSNALLSQALILCPLIQRKARVIHNGVTPDLFLVARPYQHRQSFILGIGKLEQHKGFDVLIEAFAEVAAAAADLDLLIAGSGSERPALERLAMQLSIQERISFLGQVSREDIAALMRGARIIAIPSRREPFGIVGLEALASGRPIVATTAGGLPEALEAGDATLILPDDASGLAKAIIEALGRSEAEIRQVEKTNLQVASKRTWEVTAQGYLAMFSETIH